MRKCSIQGLEAVFETISGAAGLYLPVDGKNGADYQKWEKGTVMSDALNTARSPKDFFFPQSENLMEFKTSGKTIEVIDTRESKEDFVVFGVRACDAKSFEILDRVFLTEPCDSYYADKREHGTIVTMACTRPVETCFCQTFGIDAAAPGGDVSYWKTESEVYFQANTKKGEKLLEAIAGVTEACGESGEGAAADESKAASEAACKDDTGKAQEWSPVAAVREQQQKTREIMKRLPLADLTTEGFGAGKTDELFDAPEWQELSQSCLGCGTCTFVCPTCQCYDIKDYKTGNGVIRFRCWDSCMYSDFTKMAHGNPRLTQLERFRQRFMHKLVYYPENNDGLYSCVGCGRCLAKCPISMNIVKVMKAIGGKADE